LEKGIKQSRGEEFSQGKFTTEAQNTEVQESRSQKPDEMSPARPANFKLRTPKGIHHRGAENAKVRMDLSWGQVDGECRGYTNAER
jgi:hypothetical protein